LQPAAETAEAGAAALPEHSKRCDIHYRFELLRAARPAGFESAKLFEAFQRRQV
jgi:hypothetical protein